MPRELIDKESTLVQVINGFGTIRQQAITWANVDPDLCPDMASPDHNELTPALLNLS